MKDSLPSSPAVGIASARSAGPGEAPVKAPFERDRAWTEIGKKHIEDIGWRASFRIGSRDTTKDVESRLRHGENAGFEGLYCNANQNCSLRPETIRNINRQDPDLVFFAGNQSDDHLQHTAAWLKSGLAFMEIFRERPCVTIPDDYDFGHLRMLAEFHRSHKAGCQTILGLARDRATMRNVRRFPQPVGVRLRNQRARSGHRRFL